MSSSVVAVSHEPAVQGAVFPWFAVRVKPNFEKTASAVLSGKGLEAFLPVYRQRRQWSDRIKTLDSPLFPGYLFCRLDPYRRTPVLSAPGVISIVSFGSELAPVDEKELEAVRRVVQTGIIAQPWPFLRAGRRVQVSRGPLKGVEGIVVEVDAGYSLILQISLLQRSLRVQVDRDCIQPLP